VPQALRPWRWGSVRWLAPPLWGREKGWLPTQRWGRGKVMAKTGERASARLGGFDGVWEKGNCWVWETAEV